MIGKEEKELIGKYLAGELSEEEQDEFSRAAEQNPEISRELGRQSGTDIVMRFMTGKASLSEDFKVVLPEHEGGTEMGAGEYVCEAEGLFAEAPPPAVGWLDAIQAQFGSVTWWGVSAIVHVILLLLMSLIVVSQERMEMDETAVLMNLAEKPPAEERPPPDRRELFAQEREIDMQPEELPVLVHEEVEIRYDMETENNMDENAARGQDDAISDIPLGGTGVVGSLGVGGGGAGCFGFRTGGGRKLAALRGGGSKRSEAAVDAALEWLARHQERDGRWDCDKYEGRGLNDPGVSGLALLAFLSAGHTEKTGKYRDNVSAAVRWIMSLQSQNGMIGNRPEFTEHHSGWAYHHAICGLALAEAYGMGRNQVVGEAAQRAVDYSVNVHQANYSGWRYRPRTAADVSVTGWFVMQLKSASIAGLRVDGKGFQGAMVFLDEITTKPGDNANDPYGGRAGYTSHPGNRATGGMFTTTTAMAMLGRLFMGWRHNDPVLVGGAQYLMENLPEYGNFDHCRGNGGQWPFYYWYYGTLVMFQMGGNYWKAWNGALRDMLIRHQRKGGDQDGSWDPIGAGETKYAGRVYSTALGALCLEVYYRYLPMYR
jgi:hypothetical protein